MRYAALRAEAGRKWNTVTNPYQILGVSPLDADQKIKRAYKKMKKQYRPKKYTDEELRSLAEERYAQIENAYLRIRRIRQGKEPEYREIEPDGALLANIDFHLFENAEALIEEKRYHEADRLLLKAPVSQRNAEWFYWMARTRVERFYFLDALQMIDTACGLEPSNTKYQCAREEISARAETYGSGYRLSSKVYKKKGVEKPDFWECCCACVCEGGCECCCEFLNGI